MNIINAAAAYCYCINDIQCIQNWPSITTTMKDEIGTCFGDATKK